MKTLGSRSVYLMTTIFLAALVLSAGCHTGNDDSTPPTGSLIKVNIINSAGLTTLFVNVDAPGFPTENIAMPANGSSFADSLPGAAGDVLTFTARHSGHDGVGECTATAEIVNGIVYGQVAINHDAETGAFEVICQSGWAENLPPPGQNHN